MVHSPPQSVRQCCQHCLNFQVHTFQLSGQPCFGKSKFMTHSNFKTQMLPRVRLQLRASGTMFRTHNETAQTCKTELKMCNIPEVKLSVNCINVATKATFPSGCSVKTNYSDHIRLLLLHISPQRSALSGSPQRPHHRCHPHPSIFSLITLHLFC